jgi:hypothetical protein
MTNMTERQTILFGSGLGRGTPGGIAEDDNLYAVYSRPLKVAPLRRCLPTSLAILRFLTRSSLTFSFPPEG